MQQWGRDGYGNAFCSVTSAGLIPASWSHVIPLGSLAVLPTHSGLPRDIRTFSSRLGVRLYRASSSFRCSAITFGFCSTSCFMISAGVVIGFSELSGSRAKSKPVNFPSFGWALRAGVIGMAFLGLNTSDLSWSDFRNSGRSPPAFAAAVASAAGSRAFWSFGSWDWTVSTRQLIRKPRPNAAIRPVHLLIECLITGESGPPHDGRGRASRPAGR